MTYPPPGNPDPYGQQNNPDPYGQQPNPYAQPGSPVTPGSGAPDPYAQQPGYQQPGYPPQPGYQQPAYAMPKPTNTMAIVSLICAFVFAPLAIVFGHMARKQIAQTGEEGSGLATAGLIIGYVFTGIGVLICCGYAAIIVAAMASAA